MGALAHGGFPQAQQRRDLAACAAVGVLQRQDVRVKLVKPCHRAAQRGRGGVRFGLFGRSGGRVGLVSPVFGRQRAEPPLPPPQVNRGVPHRNQRQMAQLVGVAQVKVFLHPRVGQPQPGVLHGVLRQVRVAQHLHRRRAQPRVFLCKKGLERLRPGVRQRIRSRIRHGHRLLGISERPFTYRTNPAPCL